jgi:hypothetical protein
MSDDDDLAKAKRLGALSLALIASNAGSEEALSPQELMLVFAQALTICAANIKVKKPDLMQVLGKLFTQYQVLSARFSTPEEFGTWMAEQTLPGASGVAWRELDQTTRGDESDNTELSHLLREAAALGDQFKGEGRSMREAACITLMCGALMCRMASKNPTYATKLFAAFVEFAYQEITIEDGGKFKKN